MAGTVTTTEVTYGTVQRIYYDWASTTGGVASGVSTNLYCGAVLGASWTNSTSANPTDAYDITITDAYGMDVLAGQGLNSTNGARTFVASGCMPACNSALTLNVANAGESKAGCLAIFVR